MAALQAPATAAPEAPATAAPGEGTFAADWLGTALATRAAGSTDRAAAQAAVAQAYQAAGLAAPERFIWCGSPDQGLVTAQQHAAPGSTAGRCVRAEIRTRPWAAARAAGYQELGPVGWSELWAVTAANVWRLAVDRVCTPLREHLWRERPECRLVLLDAVHGQFDAAWLAAFAGTGIRDTLAKADVLTKLDGLMAVARTTGWWWPYERLAILTELPVAIARDNLGRLHRADGPALEYPDGYGVHAWRGMPIPPSLVEELPHLTQQRITDERNAELRRVMLEHYGYDRYLREAGGEPIHEDECGKLWRLGFTNDEPLLMVEVVNSTPEPDGTRRTYHLRVPPDTRTARAGVAWTFGLTAEEYHPLVQT